MADYFHQRRQHRTDLGHSGYNLHGDLYPWDGDLSQASFRTGLRPLTQDGSLGWTMACGSGRLLADLISKKRPAISPEDFDISRNNNHKVTRKHGNSATAQ